MVLRLHLLVASFSVLGLYAQAPTLAVDANANRHPISPYIYGINEWSDNGLMGLMRIPVIRWGGDDATSFNWQNSVKNNTGDNPWCYENYSVSPGFDAFHELEGTLAAEQKIVGNAKKLSMLVAGAASQKYMQKLANQQEIMGAIADMVIETFAMDSCLLRARKFVEANGEAKSALVVAMTQVYLEGAFAKLEAAAKKVIAAVAEGDMLRTQMAIVRRLAKHDPVN